jgi:hypothetical protein
MRKKAITCAAVAALAGAGEAAGSCPWDCAPPPDGVVDVVDFLALIGQWGAGGACDADGGGVGIGDFLDLLAHWGPCPVIGACCLPGGACAVMTAAACAAAGGAPGAAGSDCADADGDRIPGAFELDDCAGAGACFAGTDPLDPDTDDDGILDGDEFAGTLGGLDLPALGADPCRKDVFVEIDWVYATGQPPDRNMPHANQVARLVAAFAAAPSVNADGSTGVSLHVDVGQAPYGGGHSVPDPGGDDTLDFASFLFDGGEHYVIKAGNFAASRNGYFRYALMADRYSVGGEYQNSSGLAEVPGDDFVVTMGQWAVGDHDFIGNTIMHELGHNLVLQHGGFQQRNFKPNYNSVMNYWYQFCGTDLDFDVIPDNGLDYSRGVNVSLDESNLVEAAGVTGAGPGIDWNLNGSASDTVSRNINCRLTDTYADSACLVHLQQSQPCGTLGECWDSGCNVLADADDWAIMQLHHLNDADLAAEVVHCLLGGALTVRRGR